VPNYYPTDKLLRAVRDLRREEERLSQTYQTLANQPSESRERFRREVAILKERAVRLDIAFDRINSGTLVSV